MNYTPPGITQLYSWIRPDERIPIDFDFSIQLAPEDGLASWELIVYDLLDDNRTDIHTDVVDAAGRTGNTLRVVFHQMAVGTSYHVEVKAETDNGQRYTRVLKIVCGTRSLQARTLPGLTRQAYLLDFESRIPAGLSIDPDLCLFSAFRERDLTEDVILAIKQGHTAEDTTLELRLENGEPGENYLVHVLAGVELDPVTDSSYLVGATLYIPCREI